MGKSKRGKGGINHNKITKHSFGKNVMKSCSSSESNGPANWSLQLIHRSLRRADFQKAKQNKLNTTSKKGNKEPKTLIKDSKSSPSSDSSVKSLSKLYNKNAQKRNGESDSESSGPTNPFLQQVHEIRCKI